MMNPDPQASLEFEPAFLKTVYGQLPQGIAVFNAGFRLAYANPPWFSLVRCATACSQNPPLAAGLAEILPSAHALQAAARQCLTSAERVQIAESSPGADHELFWDITFAPLIQDKSVTGLIMVVDDVTERVAAQRASATRARLATFRADVSQALASSDNIDAVLQACAEAMVRQAQAAFARIWVLDEADDIYQLRASAGLYTRLNGTYSRVPADRIRNKTFAAYEPDMAIDLQRTHRVQQPEWAAEQGLVAWANHPLTVRGNIIGFMVMFARQNFDPDILGELSSVADAIAQFLERKHAESLLGEREILFREIFDSAADGIAIYDPEHGKVIEGNPAIGSMHGYSPQEFADLNRMQLVHPDSRDALRECLSSVAAGHAARAHLLHLRKDGAIFPVQTQFNPIMLGNRPAVLCIVRDMTEEQASQERLEQRVAERTQELSLLLDISRNVASTLELEPLLELILKQLKSVVDYTGSAILTREADDLVIAGQLGPLSVEEARGIRHPVAAMTPVWDRLSQGEAILIHDTRDDSLEARVFRATAGDTLDQGYAFIKSCLWVPLIVKDELIGFMSITSDEPGAFNQGHIGMVEAIARQAAVAIENARLYEQARKVAILEERQRLARDLHDAVTQTLFSASLIGDALPKLWERHPQRGKVALEDLRLLTRGALAEMRALLFELRPAALTDAPLPELLRHLADAMAGRTRVVIGFTATDVPVLPPDVQIAFYRIAQEAFNNIEKHAGASRIDLEVHRAGLHGVRLRVRDNGRGFMPTGGRAGHFGMQTMRERAAAIGASLAFQSRPNHGTNITVDWPGEFNQSPTEVQ